ncbi:lectin C-type domain protein [Dictyocaulus viviparus]|uniref:Lectin C-type domain protein n=1 Tax=Dictyocaulus viviparus TaxID=29172 RepID=A0A0D8XU79_DICVI|nr:lectin C-type domain protein [Dictyocaulus viviparus]
MTVEEMHEYSGCENVFQKNKMTHTYALLEDHYYIALNLMRNRAPFLTLLQTSHITVTLLSLRVNRPETMIPWMAPVVIFLSLLTSSRCLSTDDRNQSTVLDIELYCPEGWSNLGRKCYKIYHIEKSWPQALKMCARYGAHLVRIDTPRENKFIASLFSRPGRSSNQQSWIGLASQSQVGEVAFVWSNGVPASRYVGFWKESQPDYKSGSCTMVEKARSDVTVSNTELEWSLERCNILRPFICEKSACSKVTKELERNFFKELSYKNG